MITVFTVCTTNHLHRARVLMDSVARFIPEAARHVILADPVAGRFEPSRENFIVHEPQELENIRDWNVLRFLLPASGLCCALKAPAAILLRRLFPEHELVYLDADTLLLSKPHCLFEALQKNPIILSPHLLDARDHPSTNVETMKSGAFNGGLFALRPGSESDHFLQWWSGNMLNPDKMSLDWNYDQGWLNLVPALFPEAGILRDPGSNIAFWNLHERDLSTNPVTGELLARGTPANMIHFSFFDWKTDQLLAGRLGNAYTSPPACLLEIQLSYARRLREAGAVEVEAWPYPYHHFSDGQAIRDSHRSYYRQRMAGRLPEGTDLFDAGLDIDSFRGLKSLRNAGHPITTGLRNLKKSLGFLFS